MSSDGELYAAWAAGDQRAGERLFERHYDGVARFFRNKAGEHWPELCQQTFLTCIEVRDNFRRDGSFRSFLFGIAYRQLYRHFRKRSQSREDLARRGELLLPKSLGIDLGADCGGQRVLSALRKSRGLLQHGFKGLCHAGYSLTP